MGGWERDVPKLLLQGAEETGQLGGNVVLVQSGSVVGAVGGGWVEKVEEKEAV